MKALMQGMCWRVADLCWESGVSVVESGGGEFVHAVRRDGMPLVPRLLFTRGFAHAGNIPVPPPPNLCVSTPPPPPPPLLLQYLQPPPSLPPPPVTAGYILASNTCCHPPPPLIYPPYWRKKWGSSQWSHVECRILKAHGVCLCCSEISPGRLKKYLSRMLVYSSSLLLCR